MNKDKKKNGNWHQTKGASGVRVMSPVRDTKTFKIPQ
jgi:hypothetical protein